MLDASPSEAYNPSHSEVVSNRLSGRKEGHWLRAFAEKGCRSRLDQVTKKGVCRVERSRVRTVTAQADEHVSYRVSREP